MTEIEADYLRNEKRQLELRNIEIAKAYKELKKNNARLKKESEEQLDKAREILRGLYFIIQSRINYENNTGIADEMWRAKQFLNGVSE